MLNSVQLTLRDTVNNLDSPYYNTTVAVIQLPETFDISTPYIVLGPTFFRETRQTTGYKERNYTVPMTVSVAEQVGDAHGDEAFATLIDAILAAIDSNLRKPQMLTDPTTTQQSQLLMASNFSVQMAETEYNEQGNSYVYQASVNVDIKEQFVG